MIDRSSLSPAAVLQVKAFFHELGQKEAVWIGNLKNRDLGGAVVASQVGLG
jgi:hypothetical protein